MYLGAVALNAQQSKQVVTDLLQGKAPTITQGTGPASLLAQFIAKVNAANAFGSRPAQPISVTSLGPSGSGPIVISTPGSQPPPSVQVTPYVPPQAYTGGGTTGASPVGTGGVSVAPAPVADDTIFGLDPMVAAGLGIVALLILTSKKR
jgi:hypothetical protein